MYVHQYLIRIKKENFLTKHENEFEKKTLPLRFFPKKVNDDTDTYREECKGKRKIQRISRLLSVQLLFLTRFTVNHTRKKRQQDKK